LKRFEYKFISLETLEEKNNEITATIRENEINDLGKQGFELFHIIIMNNIQCGWFKREYDG
jgi:hypothetical protein